MWIQLHRDGYRQIALGRREPKCEGVPLCSFCAKECHSHIYAGYSGDEFKMVTVRNATAMPLFIISALLCSDCQEKRQQWCEHQSGIKRGSSLSYSIDGKKKSLIIKSFFNDKEIISAKGMCYNIKELSIDKPQKITPSLF